MWLHLTLVIGFTLLTVFFCVLELSLLLLHRLRLKVFEEEGRRGARLLERILQYEKLASATPFIGVRLSVAGVAASAFLLGGELELSFWSRRGLEVGVLAAVLILVEIVPRWIVPSRPTRTLLFLVVPFAVAFGIFLPLSLIYEGILAMGAGGKRQRGVHPLASLGFPVREDLRQLISRPELDLLGQRETEMAVKLLEFGATLVRDVMTPIHKVESLGSSATIGELFDKVRDVGFTRIPIFGEDQRRLVGLVNIHDVLHESTESPVLRYLRPIPQVHSNSLAHSIFVYLQRNPSWMAAVETDSRCVGIVTVEDLVEEVLGEIYDEFETPPVGE